MKRSHLVLFGLAAVLGVAAAGSAGCGATGGRNVFGDGGSGGEDSGGNGGSGSSGQPGTGGSASDGVGGTFVGSGGNGTGGEAQCSNDTNVDNDGDGFSEAQGDCNDCDPNVSPGSIEVATDPNDPMAKPADEDCDSVVDNVAPASCDDNIGLQDTDPQNGARALDLCQFTTPADKKWGVLSAQYVRANGNPASYTRHIGIQSGFGPNVNVQKGTRMLTLSSGYARLPNQAGACGSLSCSEIGAGTPPPGFPQDVPGCSGDPDINDDVGLQVKIRSPKNATGYKFKFKFYSMEFPEYVCTAFNDQFIALVTPEPQGSINGNISFDKNTNPVSVNIAYFDVCSYDSFYPQFTCPSGPGEMEGTGFGTWDEAGGTSWLQTQAPIKGGDEVTIRWAIWDTGDTAWDSTVLVDGFEWVANGGTVVVGTDPIEDPK
ncbi:choice-of-anchor L domain-containing protein [Polyangium mundeleinium]|uniref:Choice-of-anchor L domain-containing protein n=1 Tax=Polyangium mundeleinium TaxID=2995306 RepID=A0ABT5F2V4_9BACT|nr:choice-of-anchor L domain-containing protein [Polyangium mundeleinium]MDC0748433.1 choice-of-anchor L domain-containing protein [Polyangium mundeleinium]